MRPRFLRPEILGYASVEIIRAPVLTVERTIDEAQRDAFHAFLGDPKTGPKLDAMLADNAATDAAIVPPVLCAWCADFDPTTQASGLSHGICAECAAKLEADDRLAAEDEARDELCGSTCGAGCGYCGRCS